MADDNPLLSSKGARNEKPKVTRARHQFVTYSVYNIIRYFIITSLIIWGNILHQNEQDKYVKHCCACYFISLNRTMYEGVDAESRFDLSYCIPRCTDCYYCNETFSVYEALNYSSNTCPITKNNTIPYSTPSPSFNLDWYETTGCQEGVISITAMYFWVKSFETYSILSGVAAVIYSLLQTILIFVEVKGLSNMYVGFLKWIMFYNIIFSEILLYALFKPFQYLNQNIYIDDNYVTCAINSVNSVLHFLMTYMVIGSVIFAAMHVIHIILHVSCCCCKKENIDDNARTEFESTYSEKCTNGACCVYSWISWSVVITCIGTSEIFLTIAIYEMIYARTEHDELDPEELSIIIIVTILVAASTFDLFIWFSWYDKNALNVKCCVCKYHNCDMFAINYNT